MGACGTPEQTILTATECQSTYLLGVGYPNLVNDRDVDDSFLRNGEFFLQKGRLNGRRQSNDRLLL